MCHHYQLHNLTCDEFEALRERAGGRCEICGTPEDQTGGKRLVVDHFEGRGVSFVRGLICDKCNSVMACLDGNKAWGANRRWEPQAREYEANSWHLPTPEQVDLAQRERERRRARRDGATSQATMATYNVAPTP